MLISLTIALLIALAFYVIRKNNPIKIRLKNKKYNLNIYRWMNLTSQERKRIDQQEKYQVMKNKNKLIDKIRKEYITHKKSQLKKK